MLRVRAPQRSACLCPWARYLRGRAIYAYVFKKNVEGLGTQSIIKNLILKKSKRSLNKTFSEVNDDTVKTNYYLFCRFFKKQTFYAHLKFYVGAEKKYKNPFTLFFQLSYFSTWTREPILMPTSYTCFINTNNEIELYIWCLNILFWFSIITQWIPLFPPVRTRLDICKFKWYFSTRKYETL